MSETYYFNRSTRRFVYSVDSPSPIAAPIWVLGDTRKIQVKFVESAAQLGSVSVVANTVSAQMALGTTAFVVATSATGTAIANNFYEFTVDLTSASSLVTGSRSTLNVLEFKLTDATGPLRYKTDVYIEPYLISATLTDPSPPEVALGRNEAQGIYVPKERPAGFAELFISPSGMKFLGYVGDDRQWHFDDVES